MSEIKLFKVVNEEKTTVKECIGGPVTLERRIQTVIEQNMETFFGVTFLASEYTTTNGGRMDSLGIDENHCPVIFEYKRTKNENVMNQGLFYLDWLLDHKDAFKVLVQNRINIETASNIEWSSPRIICIAGDFTKYDVAAVQQMHHDISLVRYKKFDNDLILFEHINAKTTTTAKQSTRSRQETNSSSHKVIGGQKPFNEKIQELEPWLLDLYKDVRDYILSLGDDVSENYLKYYLAFKRIKNFICLELQNKCLILRLKLDVDTVDYVEGFTRNMQGKGHLGTGDVQVNIRSKEDFIKAQALIDRAYEES